MPANFSWVDPGRVAAMARPGPGDAAWLRSHGITSLLSLAVRPPENMEGMEVCRVPMADMDAPEPEDLDRAVEFLRRVLAEGRGVAVHCDAGLGRTGTVLAAWLVAEGAPPEE
ncbi:MAG: protein-tyrosine phosphatase family protein, partial [Planctomycetota bacterium]